MSPVRCPKCRTVLLRKAKVDDGMILKAGYVLLGTDRKTIDVGCPGCKTPLRVLPGRVLRFRIMPRRREGVSTA